MVPSTAVQPRLRKFRKVARALASITLFSLLVPNTEAASKFLQFSFINGELVCEIGDLTPATTYTVLSSPELDIWNIVTNVTASAGVLQLHFPTAETRQFYRLLETAPAMAIVPAGAFDMGNCMPAPEHAASTWEDPVHSVFVSAFAMDKTEIPKELWQTVYAWATNHGYTFDNPGLAKAPNHPIHTVSWHDTLKWCNARSQMEGKIPAYYTNSEHTEVYKTGQFTPTSDQVLWRAGYRLPTEAEWEKAARGGTPGLRFPFGDIASIVFANFAQNALPYEVLTTGGFHPTYAVNGFPYTAPVMSFQPNGYDLYDMAGNVVELIWDIFSADYYPISPTNDPRGPDGPLTARVIRGGSWADSCDIMRSSARRFRSPSSPRHTVGFRCVLPLSE
jgi:formylglycine-generating enzyme required for sulfatase activity